MQRLQPPISAERAFSFASQQVPFANYLTQLDQILNTYTNHQIQVLNELINNLERHKEQKLISEKLYQLFLTKYQKLTEQIVADQLNGATMDVTKKQFSQEWDKILKAEGPRNFLIIARARAETPQETEVKNQFLKCLDQLVALRDEEGLGRQAVTLTQELQEIVITVRNTAATYASISYNTTTTQEAEKFARLCLEEAKKNLAEDIGSFRKHAVEIETQASDYMSTYQQMFPDSLQTALDQLEDYPQAIKNAAQELKDKKITLTKALKVEALSLDKLNTICEQIDSFQRTVKQTEIQFISDISQDLQNLPHHSIHFEKSIKRKQVTVEERLNRLVSELKRLAGHSIDRGPLSEIITNIKVITDRTTTDLKDYLADLQKEKKAIFTKRDLQYSGMHNAMSEHLHTLEDRLFKLLILLVKLELPSLQTEANQGPQQQYFLTLKINLEGLKKEVETVEPLWLKLRADQYEEQSAKTAETLNFVQSRIEKLTADKNHLLELPNRLVNEEYDKILKLQEKIRTFEEKVSVMVKAIKHYQGKTTQFFIGNSFKDIHDCHQLLAPIQSQKLTLTKKIQANLQDKRTFDERGQRLIENELVYLQSSYAQTIQKDDNDKVLQNLKQRYLDLQETCDAATKNLTEQSLAELQRTATLIQRTIKSLPLLGKDLNKFKRKLVKEHVAHQQEEEHLQLMQETMLWQSTRTMNAQAAQALSPEDQVKFLKLETENYQHHILKQGSNAKTKKEITRQLLAVLNEDYAPLDKLKRFETIFTPNELALRSPRENRFQKALKSLLSFFLPFKSVKQKLQRVHGGLYAEQVKKLFIEPELELESAQNKKVDGLNTSQMIQVFGPQKKAAPTLLIDNEVEMQEMDPEDNAKIIALPEKVTVVEENVPASPSNALRR